LEPIADFLLTCLSLGDFADEFGGVRVVEDHEWLGQVEVAAQEPSDREERGALVPIYEGVAAAEAFEDVGGFLYDFQTEVRLVFEAECGNVDVVKRGGLDGVRLAFQPDNALVDEDYSLPVRVAEFRDGLLKNRVLIRE